MEAEDFELDGAGVDEVWAVEEEEEVVVVEVVGAALLAGVEVFKAELGAIALALEGLTEPETAGAVLGGGGGGAPLPAVMMTGPP